MGSYQYVAVGIINKFVIDLNSHEFFLVLRSLTAKVENLAVFNHLTRVSLVSATSSVICRFMIVRPIGQNLELVSNPTGPATSVSTSITRATTTAINFANCE